MNLWRSSKRTPRDSSASDKPSDRYSMRPAPMEPTIEEHDTMPPPGEINRMRERLASSKEKLGERA